MLVKPQIGFTYDCRQCEKPITAVADLFPMHAQRYICRCSCGQSALVACIEAGRLLVEFPCPLCGQRHAESIALEKALSGTPTALHCTVTDIAACYVGTPESLAYMDSAQSDEEIAAFIGRLVGIRPPHRQPAHPEKAPHTPTAADALCAAQELAARDGLSCHCGSLRFSAAYDDGALRISCASCGASKTFSVKSAADLEKILSCGMLIL